MKNHWLEAHESPILAQYEQKLRDFKNYMIEKIDEFFKEKLEQNADEYQEKMWEAAYQAEKCGKFDEAEKYITMAVAHAQCAKAIVENIFNNEVKPNHLEPYPTLVNPYLPKENKEWTLDV